MKYKQFNQQSYYGKLHSFSLSLGKRAVSSNAQESICGYDTDRENNLELCPITIKIKMRLLSVSQAKASTRMRNMRWVRQREAKVIIKLHEKPKTMALNNHLCKWHCSQPHAPALAVSMACTAERERERRRVDIHERELFAPIFHRANNNFDKLKVRFKVNKKKTGKQWRTWKAPSEHWSICIAERMSRVDS